MSKNNQIDFDIEEPKREEQKKFILSEANYAEDGNCAWFLNNACDYLCMLICLIIVILIFYAILNIRWV